MDNKKLNNARLKLLFIAMALFSTIFIIYLVKNSSKKAVNPQYTIWMPEADNGQEFSTETPSPDGGAVDTIIGTEAINPGNSRSGSITMLSNHKFTVKHFKFSIEEVLGNEGNHIAKGGVAELK